MEASNIELLSGDALPLEPIKAGSALAALRLRFGGIELETGRDSTSAEPALFDIETSKESDIQKR